MKLNLRDFFWLILVAALAVAWWMDRWSSHARELAERANQAALKERIARLEADLNALVVSMTQVGGGTKVTYDNPESSDVP